jgi:two-component system chemotaxis response regulator CheY
MPNPRHIRVLVIDDQQSMRSLVCAGLRDLGFRDIDEAADGEEGLRTVLQVKPELILSDFHMPKLDGLNLLRVIRSHAPTKKLAFIMLTSRADRELVQQAVQLGVNNYLVKPFTVPMLREKIEAVLGPLK